SGVRRNVRCFLQVDYYDRGGEGIHTVEAYRIAKGGGQLRANSSLITSEDVKPGSHSTDALKPIQYKQVSGKMQISGGNPGGQTYSWQQHAIPHEVGHLLGLGHIANHANTCKKSGPNSKGCYGLFLEDAMNIMGAGDALSVKNAEPWRKRIIQHAPETKINHWGVDFASPEARLRGLWSLKSA
ncbi:MAG TPA: hypothetical protein VER03_04010, partial [Bryobacteraceae bacterium]|nr:hypothetical protein [Bryobacteraceae bacterium]